jgi:Family of unknown function (DUF6812)
VTTEGACIIKTDPSGRTDGNWACDPRLRQANVVVCTADCILIGTAHLMAQHRLLDELNTGFVANLHRLGDEFMPLTEVRVLYPSGAKDVALTSHVRKSSILFVAERSAGPPERNGTKEGKGHMLRVKKPLSVKVYMPPHAIEGKMHVALWQELAQALDGDNRFLPMTDVVISPAMLGGESAFPFVAINKDQILHIGELTEALQRLRQDLQRALETEHREIPNSVTSHRP